MPRLFPYMAMLGFILAAGCVRVDDQSYVVEEPNAAHVTVPASAPRKGPASARVTMIEFADFQCPYCGKVQPTIESVLAAYPAELALAFVNDPLSFHERALPCAKAFLAAARQGQAWAMHDRMFAEQTALSDAELEGHAAAIGLDLTRFATDRASQEIADQVAEQKRFATSLRVDSTPTFLIGEYRIVGAQPLSVFIEVIDKVLAGMPEAGP